MPSDELSGLGEKKHVTSLCDKSLIFINREYAGRFYQKVCFSPSPLNECLRKGSHISQAPLPWPQQHVGASKVCDHE